MKRLDPPRLLESEAADAELRTLLAAGADDLAPPDVLARSARRLSAALGVQVTPPVAHVTGAKAAGSAAAGAKWLGLSAAVAIKGACVVALVSTASLLAWHRLAPATRGESTVAQSVRTAPARIGPQRASEPMSLPQPVIAKPSPNTAPLVAAADAPRPQPLAARVRTPRRAAARVEASSTLVPQPAPPVPQPDRAQELRALEAAHAVLASDPLLALQRLRALARTYPNGWLDEERGALEVEALLRLGQRDEAARALEQLQERHPHAAALPGLQRTLAQPR